MTNSKQNTYKTAHVALKQQILKQITYKTVRETLITNSQQNTYKTVYEALMQQILKQNTYKIVNEALT